jgi:hypothetical protein
VIIFKIEENELDENNATGKDTLITRCWDKAEILGDIFWALNPLSGKRLELTDLHIQGLMPSHYTPALAL